MSDSAPALLVALGLLIGNAFFVGAEFALVSARRTQIEPRVAEGSRAARVTLRAMEQVSSMMAGAQLGITVCSLGLGAIAEPAVAHLLQVPFAAAGLPDGLVHPLAFAVAMTIVVFFHMVLGEMVPKNIALAGPERSALVLGPVLYALVWASRPVVWILNGSANTVLRLMRVAPQEEVTTAFSREEVAGFVAESGREGLLDDEEFNLLGGALGFEDRNASHVLLPLSEVVTAPATASPAVLEELCARTGFSRFPVRDADGAITGYLHVRDLISMDPRHRDEPVLDEALRPLARTRTDAPLRTVMSTMQDEGAHLAAVEDSNGDVVGVVTLEDVLEELVGEVRDATRT
ncbi:hemolysin family protein [Georgenia halophila]|uniref:Hemolysin family protein n=1 Tax=Georgenia halophila TaxID=620889 RepID=A0ABP8KTT7_9MICO